MQTKEELKYYDLPPPILNIRFKISRFLILFSNWEPLATPQPRETSADNRVGKEDRTIERIKKP